MKKLLLLLVLGSTLTGCANVRLISSDVSSYSQWNEKKVTPKTFVFERLPSQNANPKLQDDLESAALPALERAGLKWIDHGTPDLQIQVSGKRTMYNPSSYDNWGPRMGVGGFYGGRRTTGAGFFYSMHDMESDTYVFDVSVIMRDSKTKDVVYETRAHHEGVWSDRNVRKALFDAALKDYPNAWSGSHRVDIEVPRQ